MSRTLRGRDSHLAGADMEGEALWAGLCVCVWRVLGAGLGRPGGPRRAFLGT